MDILSDILSSLRVSGSVYFCSHVEPPWEKSFIDKTTAGFHMVRRGACWLKVGDRIEYLQAGDLVFIGPGIDHYLSSEHPLETSIANTQPTLLLCGDCSFDKETLTPLKSAFTDITIVREEEFIEHPWLKSTFDQISSEYMAQHPGSEIIVNKLTEVILVELIRINFARQESAAFVNALKDKRIKNALQYMHDAPHQAWTIESLASLVGMSRASFSKRFNELVGETVFSYLSMLRIQKAKELIKTTPMMMDDVALNVGYESERAFTKTFNKYVGMTPKQYRKSSI